MESSRLASGLGCAYLAITLIVHICFGVAMTIYSSNLVKDDLITTDAMQEVIRDWNVIPFTSI